MQNCLELIRDLRQQYYILRGRQINPKVEATIRMERFGTLYGGYWVCPDYLGPDSIVYSFGIGEDVSFDVEMINRFGCSIQAFDPTPRSIDWIRKQDLPEGFNFRPIGIGSYDGKALFYPPKNPEFVSYSVLHEEDPDLIPFEGEVRRISTLMKENAHSLIDLLKMDIEGAEYEVLQDIIASGESIGQICLEFHHRYKKEDVRRTLNLLEHLREVGFRVSHWYPRNSTCSLIHEDYIAK